MKNYYPHKVMKGEKYLHYLGGFTTKIEKAWGCMVAWPAEQMAEKVGGVAVLINSSTDEH